METFLQMLFEYFGKIFLLNCLPSIWYNYTNFSPKILYFLPRPNRMFLALKISAVFCLRYETGVSQNKRHKIDCSERLAFEMQSWVWTLKVNFVILCHLQLFRIISYFLNRFVKLKKMNLYNCSFWSKGQNVYCLLNS